MNSEVSGKQVDTLPLIDMEPEGALEKLHGPSRTPSMLIGGRVVELQFDS